MSFAFFQTQGGDLLDHFLVVILVVFVCPCRVGTIHFFSQCPVVSVFHKRPHARVVEGENPSFLAPLFGRHSCHFLGTFGETGKVFLVGHVQLERVGLGQFVFIKGQA